MKVTYWERGIPFDFKRIDHVRTVTFIKTWEVGGLLYGYVDRFNTRAIAKEDIISIE